MVLSAVLGGAIGLEREWRGKWAGLRTHMLIAVGAALITDVSISVGAAYGPEQGWDPGRIAAQIVSGLGFIGAGTIIQARGAVHGLTTAAGLWVAGAIGLAVGAGFFPEATVATLALLVILGVMRPIEQRFLGGRRRSLVIGLGGPEDLPRLLELLTEIGIETDEVQVTPTENGLSVRVRYEADETAARRLARRTAESDWLDVRDRSD